MTWNFDYIIPTFVVLVFFLFFYLLKPVFLTRSNKIFLLLIISEVLAFCLESYSCYIDINCNLYSRFFIASINNISLTFFASRYIIISMYFFSLLHLDMKKYIQNIIMAITSLLVFALIMTNPFTDMLYTISDKGEYQRTDSYILYYFACIFPLIVSFYYVIRFRKKLEKTEFVSIILAILCLLISCIMKILFEHYLVTDAFFVFILMGLFFIFENPDIIIDKRTGLLNFSAFHEIISEYIINAKSFSVISFTIKNYNEKRQIYGSMQSELALKEMGKYFLSLSHFRKCFYLRNGNFVIVDKTNKNFQKLRQEVGARFEQSWNVNNASINVDIIIVDMDSDVNFSSFDEMSAGFGFSFSDAKKQSLNFMTITKESLLKTTRRAQVSKALNKSLLEDSLQVYLQPIVEASSRKIVAAEALVRIFDNELGVVPPVEFITMAERNGSIEKLGEQVLNKVCIFLKETKIYKYGIEWINVNLSPIQCQNKELSQKIDSITSTNTIDHKYIHLEITEESIIDTDILRSQMNVLILDGYKFSLDDFGAGFANVSRVKLFPFNNIKLDMGIVQEHFKNPDDILPSVVKSFNNRGLSVTAEGVETKEMADMLEEMGCKYLQGYYFSKPIPSNDFEKLIREKNNIL